MVGLFFLVSTVSTVVSVVNLRLLEANLRLLDPNMRLLQSEPATPSTRTCDSLRRRTDVEGEFIAALFGRLRSWLLSNFGIALRTL